MKNLLNSIVSFLKNLWDKVCGSEEEVNVESPLVVVLRSEPVVEEPTKVEEPKSKEPKSEKKYKPRKKTTKKSGEKKKSDSVKGGYKPRKKKD
jgi:hypothetical protein